MAGEAHSPRNNRCERARQWASLRLDGELSELEEVLLEKHLEGCSACLAFEARMQRTTELVRLTPAEIPQLDFAPPPRRLVTFPVNRRIAVVGIAAAAALGSLVGSNLQRPEHAAPTQSVPQVSLLTRDMNQLRELKTHKPSASPVREPGNPPKGII
jgi:anti-sigma factor RsiW